MTPSVWLQVQDEECTTVNDEICEVSQQEQCETVQDRRCSVSYSKSCSPNKYDFVKTSCVLIPSSAYLL